MKENYKHVHIVIARKSLKCPRPKVGLCWLKRQQTYSRWWLLERAVNVWKKICLGAEHVSVLGDLSVAIVSACQALSIMKGLPEGTEDGVRDTLYEFAHTSTLGHTAARAKARHTWNVGKYKST